MKEVRLKKPSEVPKTPKFDTSPYFTDPKEMCIDCADCISPKHKIIKYKYPKKLGSRYVELFKLNP